MKESELSMQAVMDSYQAPWILQGMTDKRLNTTLAQVHAGLHLWKNDTHQNRNISTAIVQHQHTIHLLNKIIRSKSKSAY